MSRWFRHYAGMARDDKLVRAAIKSGQPVERAVWVWAAILESAAEIDDGGRFELDSAEVAYFLRADESDIASIVHALEGGGRISGSYVVHWGDRQFQSDRSAERQRRHREKQKTNGDDHGEPRDQASERHTDDDVTALSRHCDAPETETHTEAEKKKEHIVGSAIAAPHPAVAGNAGIHPEEPKPKSFAYPQEFDDLWNQYRAICEVATADPGSKKNAFERWRKLSAEDRERCFDGVMQYLLWRDGRSEKPGLFTAQPKHFERFISGRLWETYQAEAA